MKAQSKKEMVIITKKNNISEIQKSILEKKSDIFEI
jgi:hypothetical protein